MRMLEKVLEEGDEAFRWHRQYSERRRRQSHVVLAWMLKCKLYESREKKYAIARRMPSRDTAIRKNLDRTSAFLLVPALVVFLKKRTVGLISRGVPCVAAQST